MAMSSNTRTLQATHDIEHVQLFVLEHTNPQKTDEPNALLAMLRTMTELKKDLKNQKSDIGK
jgi:hypothetical protein